MLDKAKYRELFVQEAHEHIQRLNQALLKLEKEPEASGYIDELFRAAHTLKGVAATMSYDQIMQLCKAIEEVLDVLRKGKSKLSTHTANILFKCFDVLEEMVDDESKKVDLKPYLRELKNPSEIERVGEDEPSFPTKSQTIRVKMEDLDSLVNLVGELVIAKMRLDQIIPAVLSEETRQTLVAFSRIVSNLQDQTMKLRLVPIEQVFNRFPRMVRDLSKNQGKEVKFEMGELGIELDRVVLDAITDPLLHILRNAVDHGIESSLERKKLGKTKYGNIRLVASRIGEKVVILVEDDGRGIDVERIKSIAIKNKLVSSTEAESMTGVEVLDLLGTPGLTGAKYVTDVSGRGVGFNVVRNQVESVGGQVKIETKKGLGTHITLTLPLSLAIIEGLLVKVAGQRYMLPLSSITTILQVDSREIKNVHGNDMIMFMDQVVPLMRLQNLLGIQTDDVAEKEKVTVVIVNKGEKFYGLVVDVFERKQEIVIKRLDSTSAASSKFSNATILSDGKVVLILDPVLLL